MIREEIKTLSDGKKDPFVLLESYGENLLRLSPEEKQAQFAVKTRDGNVESAGCLPDDSQG